MSQSRSQFPSFVPRIVVTGLIISRFVLAAAFLAGIVFTTQIAIADGGGVDGGGGGGRLVPLESQSGPGLTKIFDQGVSFLTEGKCKDAEKKFEHVLEKVPRNSQANFLRGVSLQCQNRYKRAIRFFKLARRDDAKYWAAYEQLGMSYLVLKRRDLAEMELARLDEFKDMCRLRCPAGLLKSRGNLIDAMKRIDGEELDSDDDDKHGMIFGPVSERKPHALAASSVIRTSTRTHRRSIS